jgi:hypothetical protein
MKTIKFYSMLLCAVFISQNLVAQDEPYDRRIEVLESMKEKIVKSEKDALKDEVEKINKRLKNNDITSEEAVKLKEDAAKKHALNIENRVAILDNKIALLVRNGNSAIVIDSLDYVSRIEIGFGTKSANNERLFGIWLKENPNRESVKYDRRTYVDPVIAFGLNNTIIEGQSLEDSDYKLGGSWFSELGWAWRTRVLKNSNALRFSYGVSFQFNGLKPKNNQFFAVENGETVLQEFEYDLKKSKFRMDNLVFPIHLEFGPSKFIESEKKIRYSIRNQFRFGIGGYGGFNIGARQSLKYTRDGRNVKDKLKGGYNTSNFIYGLSAYAGFDGVQLYAKYDLNPIFKDALVEQRNISLGVRFDLD